MTTIYSAEKQLTHKYNPDWSHLDSWETLPWTWRILSKQSNAEGFGYDDGYRTVMRIKVYGEHDQDDLINVLRGHFRRGCSCEYDCCGHYFGGLTLTKFDNSADYSTGKFLVVPANNRKGEYIITTSYSPNY
jgi:hypothetical protein